MLTVSRFPRAPVADDREPGPQITRPFGLDFLTVLPEETTADLPEVTVYPVDQLARIDGRICIEDPGLQAFNLHHTETSPRPGGFSDEDEHR